jgi:actin-related protein 2
VCDNGTGYLKMGYAGDNFPRFQIPSVVGRPMLRSKQDVGGVELQEIMYGDQAAPYRSLLDITYPIGEGRILNWDDFSQLWSYTFHTKMGIPKDLSEKKILVTEPALSSHGQRKKLLELIFEEKGFSGCMFETQALLSLMCEGCTTGIVFDSGDGVSHVIPVVDGFVQKHAV